jgi:type I restriction enzyme S subunit
MKLETFFEKFDQFADAPDAVAKMRELILDFAIGGRLLRTSESAELEANGGWPKQTLGSIASLITKGSTPTSYGHQYEASGIPFVKVENIADGVINRSSMEQFISEATHEFLKRSQLESGDILFSIAGTIGKTCVVSSDDVPANTNQALAIIRGFSASFEIPFLKMQLDSFVANKVKAKARGGAMPNVSLGDLRDLLVVVPPLAEQKRIVAKVDELMALCDRLQAQQQERETRHAALARASLARFADTPTPANLPFLFHPSYAIPPADLRKSILTLAVQGKLVPQDPNDEPAEVLLEKVRKARRELADKGDVKTKVQLAAIGPEQEPYSIPDTWLWVPLNELTKLVYGKLLPTTELLPDGFQVFGANGIIGRFSRYLYEDEMLLISCRGAYSGTPNISPPKCYVTNNSIVCEFFEPKACDIRFYHAVISISPREKIVTGSAQPQVTVANAIKLPVPLPPLAEQRRIVAKVEQLMTLVDALETQLAASRATAANLLSALVAELTVSEGAYSHRPVRPPPARPGLPGVVK